MKRPPIAIIGLILWVSGLAATDVAALTPSHALMPPEEPPTVVTTHLDIVDPSDGLVSLREALSHILTHPRRNGPSLSTCQSAHP